MGNPSRRLEGLLEGSPNKEPNEASAGLFGVLVNPNSYRSLNNSSRLLGRILLYLY